MCAHATKGVTCSYHPSLTLSLALASYCRKKEPRSNPHLLHFSAKKNYSWLFIPVANKTHQDPSYITITSPPPPPSCLDQANNETTPWLYETVSFCCPNSATRSSPCTTHPSKHLNTTLHKPLNHLPSPPFFCSTESNTPPCCFDRANPRNSDISFGFAAKRIPYEHPHTT